MTHLERQNPEHPGVQPSTRHNPGASKTLAATKAGHQEASATRLARASAAGTDSARPRPRSLHLLNWDFPRLLPGTNETAPAAAGALGTLPSPRGSSEWASLSCTQNNLAKIVCERAQNNSQPGFPRNGSAISFLKFWNTARLVGTVSPPGSLAPQSVGPSAACLGTGRKHVAQAPPTGRPRAGERARVRARLEQKHEKAALRSRSEAQARHHRAELEMAGSGGGTPRRPCAPGGGAPPRSGLRATPRCAVLQPGGPTCTQGVHGGEDRPPVRLAPPGWEAEAASGTEVRDKREDTQHRGPDLSARVPPPRRASVPSPVKRLCR